MFRDHHEEIAAMTQARTQQHTWYYQLGQRLCDELPEVPVNALLEDGTTVEDLVGLLSDRTRVPPSVSQKRNLDKLQTAEIRAGWEFSEAFKGLS